jgi:hypothetical protein
MRISNIKNEFYLDLLCKYVIFAGNYYFNQSFDELTVKSK